MTEFRGFNSENEALGDARAHAGTLGYSQADVCTCTHPRLGAHLRRDHDAKVTARQRAYALELEAIEQRNGGV